MPSLSSRIVTGLRLPLQSFALFVRNPQLLWYAAAVCVLTALYLNTPLNSVWHTNLAEFLSPGMRLLLLNVLRNILRMCIYAACCYHVSLITDKKRMGIRELFTASMLLNIFAVVLLNFVPTVIQYIFVSADNAMNPSVGVALDWLNPSVGITVFKLLWEALMFYVLVVVVVDGASILRASAASCKALKATWVEALVGTLLLGGLGTLLQPTFTLIRRLDFIADHLFDSVTQMPNVWWKTFMTTEFCLASFIVLTSLVFRTLLYKRYKAGV
jgi:hypothetical protein